MSGRFNGLNRSQWKILKPLFLSPHRMGRPGVLLNLDFNYRISMVRCTQGQTMGSMLIC